MRHDRLLAAEEKSHTHSHIQELRDLSANLIDEIEHFFTSYDGITGKQFEPLHRRGAKAAKQLVEQGERAFRSIT